MDYQLDAEAIVYSVTTEPEPGCITPLAMAYVPVQQWDCVYEDCHRALQRGTIFPNLDKPFLEGACPNV